MSTDDTAPGAELAGHDSTAEHDAAALRASEAAGTMAREQAARLEEAIAAARLQERARIRAIVNFDAAVGREKQALMLATETALSTVEAEKILCASPKETRIDALAQRASAGPEFGSSREAESPNPTARAEEGWKRAIANANRRFARA